MQHGWRKRKRRGPAQQLRARSAPASHEEVARRLICAQPSRGERPMLGRPPLLAARSRSHRTELPAPDGTPAAPQQIPGHELRQRRGATGGAGDEGGPKATRGGLDVQCGDDGGLVCPGQRQLRTRKGDAGGGRGGRGRGRQRAEDNLDAGASVGAAPTSEQYAEVVLSISHKLCRRRFATTSKDSTRQECAGPAPPRHTLQAQPSACNAPTGLLKRPKLQEVQTTSGRQGAQQAALLPGRPAGGAECHGAGGGGVTGELLQSQARNAPLQRRVRDGPIQGKGTAQQ
mmetsp:Transcript_78540/g.255047  ORF Transcript_78540/g.255047 Transcript_78540/m.255047 type:complete len:287 (-) Transcript_78540:2429-3289(-)